MLARSARRLSPMAAKRPLTPAGVPNKRPATLANYSTTEMATENPFKAEFEKYRDQLNEMNDKRERLVKASRDVTQSSKKVIFQVHRIGKHNQQTVLNQAEKDIEGVTTQHVSRIAKELQGSNNDVWKFRRAYSPGMQEYVEAATVLEFCKSGKLLTLADLNSRLTKLSDPSTSPLKINLLDYLLGIGDLTGELMRLAISQVADGEVEVANTICNFVRDLYKDLSLVTPITDDSYEMNKKMETMLQSLVKIENACYAVRIRGSEYITDAQGEQYRYTLALDEEG